MKVDVFSIEKGLFNRDVRAGCLDVNVHESCDGEWLFIRLDYCFRLLLISQLMRLCGFHITEFRDAVNRIENNEGNCAVLYDASEKFMVRFSYLDKESEFVLIDYQSIFPEFLHKKFYWNRFKRLKKEICDTGQSIFRSNIWPKVSIRNTLLSINHRIFSGSFEKGEYPILPIGRDIAVGGYMVKIEDLVRISEYLVEVADTNGLDCIGIPSRSGELKKAIQI